MVRRLWLWVLAGAAIYAVLALLCPQYLPGHLDLVYRICPPSWHFYTPHHTSGGGCGLPMYWERWVGPALAGTEGALLGGIAYQFNRIILRQHHPHSPTPPDTMEE